MWMPVLVALVLAQTVRAQDGEPNVANTDADVRSVPVEKALVKGFSELVVDVAEVGRFHGFNIEMPYIGDVSPFVLLLGGFSTGDCRTILSERICVYTNL
jgi:hypothetical protein